MSKDTATARRSFAVRSAAAVSAALLALVIFFPGGSVAGLLDWAISGVASAVRQMKHSRRRAEYFIRSPWLSIEVNRMRGGGRDYAIGKRVLAKQGPTPVHVSK